MLEPTVVQIYFDNFTMYFFCHFVNIAGSINSLPFQGQCNNSSLSVVDGSYGRLHKLVLIYIEYTILRLDGKERHDNVDAMMKMLIYIMMKCVCVCL